MISSLGLFYFCPESPRALLLLKRDESATVISLKMLRKNKFVQEDVVEISREANLPTVGNKLVWIKSVLLSVNLVLTIIFLEFLFFIPFYKTFNNIEIFISIDALIANIFCSLLLGLFSDVALLKISLIAITLTVVSIVAEALINFIKFPEKSLEHIFTDHIYLTTVLTGLYVFFFSIGLVPITLLYSSDRFKENERSISAAVSTSALWTFYIFFQLSFSLLVTLPFWYLLLVSCYLLLLISLFLMFCANAAR